MPEGYSYGNAKLGDVPASSALSGIRLPNLRTLDNNSGILVLKTKTSKINFLLLIRKQIEINVSR